MVSMCSFCTCIYLLGQIICLACYCLSVEQIDSFSLRHRRHLTLCLYDLWVSTISQDVFEVLFADMIF